MEIVGYEVVEARIPESKDSGSVKNMFRGDVKTAISANPSLVIVIIFWNFEKSTIFDRPFRENYTYINKDIYRR